MPQTCKVCNHPQADEINRHIITGDMSLRQIAKKYNNISYSGIRYHKANHLSEVMEKVKIERVESAEAVAIDTLSVLDRIIAQIPKVVDTANLNTILKALELRAKITGEAEQPPLIKIEWGLQLDENHLRRVDHVRYKVLQMIEDAGEDGDLSALDTKDEYNLPDLLPDLDMDADEDSYDKEIDEYLKRKEAIAFEYE